MGHYDDIREQLEREERVTPAYEVEDLVVFINKDDWVPYGSVGEVTEVSRGFQGDYEYTVEFTRLEKFCLCSEEDLEPLMDFDEFENDAINPDHYKVGGIETIDYMKAKMTNEEFIGYLKGNILKYTSRIGHKDSASQEAGKIEWYAGKLKEVLDGTN